MVESEHLPRLLDSRPFIDVSDALVEGTSLRDTERHALVRDGFVTALLEDVRTEQAMRAWLAVINRDVEAGTAHPIRRIWEKIARRAERFVRQDLRLPWPWLAFELGEAFMLHLIYRTPAVARRRLVADLQAPPIAIHSDPPHGQPETISQAATRVLRVCAAAMAHIHAADAAARRDGRAPKQGGAHLRRWGRWLYATKVGGRNVTQLARENHKTQQHSRAFEDCDCRTIVRKGVAAAERLLSLSAYLYPPTDREQ